MGRDLRRDGPEQVVGLVGRDWVFALLGVVRRPREITVEEPGRELVADDRAPGIASSSSLT
jgi:hypothetical protein